MVSGEVVRIMDFGAFVELPTGESAMLHISEISKEKVCASPAFSACHGTVSIGV